MNKTFAAPILLLFLVFLAENSVAANTISAAELATFRTNELNKHNELRALHQNTNPVALNSFLNRQAQNWAEHLLSIGKFKHSREAVRLFYYG